MKGALKSALMPSGLQVRTLPMGIGRGIRMDIDFSHETRLYLGLYEIELNRHLVRICQPGVKTFDVGGQYGYDALIFAKLTGAQVVSFECDDAAFDRLGRTVDLNPTLGPLVRPIRAAVGTGRDGSISIDEYCADSFVPDFIKVDVEGAEFDVLRGAASTLVTRHPALVVEVHSAHLEERCGMLLLEHGYRPRVISQRRLWPDFRPTDEVNRWLVATQ